MSKTPRSNAARLPANGPPLEGRGGYSPPKPYRFDGRISEETMLRLRDLSVWLAVEGGEALKVGPTAAVAVNRVWEDEAKKRGVKEAGTAGRN